MLDQKTLKSMLSYDPETGAFHWTTGALHHVHIGKRAGTKWKGCPYLIITLAGRRYRAHRLAWLYMTGAWPKKLVDHEDTDQLNNRWKNLREATPSQNIANSRNSKNRALPKGVTFRKSSGKFIAQIKKDRKTRYLGSFNTASEAQCAYILAAKELFGTFARAA